MWCEINSQKSDWQSGKTSDEEGQQRREARVVRKKESGKWKVVKKGEKLEVKSERNK